MLQVILRQEIVYNIYKRWEMGKKGVMLDNGKNAQSSMALYWKKHHEQQKKPKKEYQPTQQQQLDQRVQSGFQKWKQHKQKMINKNFQKKDKPHHNKQPNTNKDEDEEQEEQLMYEKQKEKEKKMNLHIPGFKSKEALKCKLKTEQQVKEVSQVDNVLKLPPHMAGITQQDILRILREKKAKEISKKKQVAEVEDVMLGDNFLESFKLKPKEDEKVQPVVEEKQENPVQENFFKSDILNQISKGNTSVILPPGQKPEPQPQKNESTSPVAVSTPQLTQKPQSQAPRQLMFKPRALK